MKKLFTILLAVLMLATSAFVLASCGNTEETIKVGLIGPYTGELAQYGLAVQQGARLYFDKVPTINGKKLEIIWVDSKGSDTDAVTAYNRLKSQGVVAIMGAVVSGNTKAVVSVARADNMPVVTASATAESVTVNDDGSVNANAFRACFIDSFQGQKAADYAKKVLNASKVAVLYCSGDAYSAGLAEEFSKQAKTLGVDVVVTESYAKGDVDFSSQLSNIATKNVDLVFCPNYYEDDGKIITQARSAGIKCQFLGGDGWDGVLNYASKEDLEGTIYVAGYASAATEKIKTFEKEFTDKFGSTYLNMFAAEAYDAAMLIVNGITYAEGKGLKQGSADYEQAIIDGIRTQSGSTDGVTSTGYTFDKYNNPIKQAFMVKIVNGKATFDRIY